VSTPPFEPIACDPRSRTAYAHNAIHDLTAFALMPCPLLSPYAYPFPLPPLRFGPGCWCACAVRGRIRRLLRRTHTKCSKQRLQLWRMAEAWEKREREAAPTRARALGLTAACGSLCVFERATCHQTSSLVMKSRDRCVRSVSSSSLMPSSAGVSYGQTTAAPRSLCIIQGSSWVQVTVSSQATWSALSGSRVLMVICT
jgi:hypothetical protein